MSNKCWDVLGFGIVAVDELLTVREYPPPDIKMPVLEKLRQGGGLTGTALVTASRLGATCAYAGILGEDDLSNWTLAELEREGIDCSLTVRRADARPIYAVIIVDTTHHTRNIFYSSAGYQSRQPDEIDADTIAQARVLFVDHSGTPGMLQAVRFARQQGIPTVADIERSEHADIPTLITEIDHLILSGAGACQFGGLADPVEAIRYLHRQTPRACTAVTLGEQGCWYISGIQADTPKHQPAFKVEVVDTTGCGDVFHGAYAAGIAHGWGVSRCIRFASAAAAIKATRAGGRAGIPDAQTVLRFLEEHRQR